MEKLCILRFISTDIFSRLLGTIIVRILESTCFYIQICHGKKILELGRRRAYKGGRDTEKERQRDTERHTDSERERERERERDQCKKISHNAQNYRHLLFEAIFTG